MRILNLTQHIATPDQVVAGVIEPDNKALVAKWLTFDELPSSHELEYRARNLAMLAEGYNAAMIGGAPYFMAPLERAIAAAGVKVLYAFSVRESVEVPQEDGTVKKTQIFKHAGFIEAAFISRLLLYSCDSSHCKTASLRMAWAIWVRSVDSSAPG